MFFLGNPMENLWILKAFVSQVGKACFAPGLPGWGIPDLVVDLVLTSSWTSSWEPLPVLGFGLNKAFWHLGSCRLPSFQQTPVLGFGPCGAWEPSS